MEHEPFRIHPALESYVRRQSEEENRLLEESLLAEGCRDPLVVWKEENVLIDGHHRKRICDRHNIGYSVVYRSFADIDEAKAWMDLNSLGRRNLDRADRDEMIRRLAARGVKQKDIAEKVGLTQQAVSKITKTDTTKLYEPRINATTPAAEIEAKQAELDSLRKRLKDEQDERDREKRELVKALNEAQAKARQAGPEVVEKEVIREVVPDIIKERLARLEGDLRTAKSREAELERLIQDAKKHGKDIETLLSQKNDIQRSLKELAEKNDLAQEERQQALALVSAARKIREVLNEQKGVIEEASKKGVPAWANAVSIRECAERCYDIGDLLTKATNTVDIPTGTEGEYERHRVG